MTDFRVKTSWRTHPKRVKLERRHGPKGVLSVEDLWSFCADEREDGDLSGMSNEDIAIAAQWPGDHDAFVSALVDLRLLDGEPGAYQIHDWYEINPYVATSGQRSEAASIGAKVRWHGEGKHGAPVAGCPLCDAGTVACQADAPASQNDAGRMRSDANRNAPVPTPAPAPNPMKASAQNARDPGKAAPTNQGSAEELGADALVAAVRQWPDWVENTKPETFEAKARAMAPFTRDEVRFARAQAQNDPGKPSLGLLLAKVEFQRKGAAKKPTGVPERNATAPPKRPPPTPRPNEPRFQGASIAAVKRLVADLVEEKAAPP